MRLFLALNLPADLRAAIHAAAAPLRDTGAPVKWVAPDAIHLTLKFLGDTADDIVPAIREAMTVIAAARQPFAVPVGGFGAFPTAERPRVIWIGCEAEAPLELLQHDVETAMAKLGYAVEGRPFRPHLTLGRAKKGGEREAAGLAGPLEALEFFGEFRAASLDLMQSTLTPQGARYAVAHAAPFGGAPA